SCKPFRLTARASIQGALCVAGNVLVGTVLAHERVIAARRRAVTARAGRFHDEASASGHAKRSLAVELPNGAVRELEPKPHRTARKATREAKWRGDRAFAAHGGVRLVPEHPPDAARAEPAAPSAGAARVGDQRIFLDPQWESHFKHFDRRIHHVADGAGDGIDAVLARPGAEAA